MDQDEESGLRATVKPTFEFVTDAGRVAQSRDALTTWHPLLFACEWMKPILNSRNDRVLLAFTIS
jgi:hypothetical protein